MTIKAFSLNWVVFFQDHGQRILPRHALTKFSNLSHLVLKALLYKYLYPFL